MRLYLSMLSAIIAVVSTAASADSLRNRDVGMYGNAWKQWAVEESGRLDFLILQVQLDSDLDALVEFVDAARALDTRVVLRLQIHLSKAQRAAVQGAEPLREVNYYVNHYASLLERLKDRRPEAIVIDEENVFWQGRARFLAELYHGFKQRHPQHRFYQWYSGSLKLNVPGESRWPILPADGWVFDQYSMEDETFGQYVAGMRRLGKPLLAVLWASPNWHVGNKGGKPDDAWWNQAGWKSFYAQLAHSRAHGIPVSFFAFGKSANGRLVPLWNSSEPCDVAFVEAFTKRTIPMLRSDDKLPVKTPAVRPDWIPGYCEAQ
jgi:hypothetical protein